MARIDLIKVQTGVVAVARYDDKGQSLGCALVSLDVPGTQDGELIATYPDDAALAADQKQVAQLSKDRLVTMDAELAKQAAQVAAIAVDATPEKLP